MKTHALLDLLVSLVVLMSLFAAVKLALASVPDDGIPGDIKKFLMLA
jgi:hypothetical protein